MAVASVSLALPPVPDWTDDNTKSARYHWLATREPLRSCMKVRRGVRAGNGLCGRKAGSTAGLNLTAELEPWHSRRTKANCPSLWSCDWRQSGTDRILLSVQQSHRHWINIQLYTECLWAVWVIPFSLVDFSRDTTQWLTVYSSAWRADQMSSSDSVATQLRTLAG